MTTNQLSRLTEHGIQFPKQVISLQGLVTVVTDSLQNSAMSFERASKDLAILNLQ